MQKFENTSLNRKEKAIKVGNNVPSGSVGLSLFSVKDISPENNISMVDLSETILENRINKLSSDNEAIITYADELGILHTEDGNYSFPSNELTVSNLFHSTHTLTDKYDIENLNGNDFVHFYYISRFFISAPSSFSLISLSTYIDLDKFNGLNLKVVDEKGEDYIDKNTGRKKYRFLLEPFNTSTNYNRSERPYRVVVMFDATEPANLRLVYDKVECDQYGNMFNIFLNYNESINYVPFYNEIPEEGFVLDDNYKSDRNFAIKKIESKYSEIMLNRESSSGYQVFVPNKALDDNRNFQIFNWRFIARTNNSINYSSIDETNSSSELVNIKTINAGVLYSSSLQEDNRTISPYVFQRLLKSPFNLVSYDFVNPITEAGLTNGTISDSITKSNDSYWKVNIDNSNVDLTLFDVLVWCPDGVVSVQQASKIQNFVDRGGTIILDLSTPSANARTINPQLRVAPSVSGQVLDVNSDNVLINKDKNGGWSLSDDIYEKDEYGIYGSNYVFPSTYAASGRWKEYPYFENVSISTTSATSANSFLNSTLSSTLQRSLGIVIPFIKYSASAQIRGNIIACTFPLLSYCNSVYDPADYELIKNSNIDSTEYIDSNKIYSGIVEGPFKFLFNCVSYAAYCRTQASRKNQANSSLYNFVSEWNSNWVLDPNVLFDDERQNHFVSVPELGTYGVEIVQEENLHTKYLSSLRELVPSYQKDQISELDTSRVEFFIEITNPNVIISNAELVDKSTFDSTNNIPSAYTLYKVNNPLNKLYAYTNIPSDEINIPEGFGPYVIKDKIIKTSENKGIDNRLNILSGFNSYPFSFSTKYSYCYGTDLPIKLDGTLSNRFNMVFKGDYTRTIEVINPPQEITMEVTVTKSCEQFKSAIDDFDVKVYSSRNPLNTFIYSGDIDIHKLVNGWKIGSRHEYVKYIQYTMVVALNNSAIKVDGIFGRQTYNAVVSFQRLKNQRYDDGSVDSETKSYMAWFWKDLKKTNLTKYTSVINWAKNNPTLSPVVKYIEAAVNVGTVSQIGTKTYRKINFSGFRGPGQAKDLIFLKIPDDITEISKLTIKAGPELEWQNFGIDIYGYSSTYQTDVFKTTNVGGFKPVKNGIIEIPFNNRPASQARYVWFQVIGETLSASKFGYAEGFSIASIEVTGKTKVVKKVDGGTTTKTITSEIYALADVQTYDQFNELDVANPLVKRYFTNSLPRAGSKVISIKVGCDKNGSFTNKTPFPNGDPFIPNISSDSYSIDLTDTRQNTFFSKNGITIDFLYDPTYINLTSSTVSSVFAQNASVSTNLLSTSISNNILSLETSAVYYQSSKINVSIPRDISGYQIRRASSELDIYPYPINSVNINDGIVLLCNANGTPFGIISSEEINSLARSQASGSSEYDFRFGEFTVNNKLGDDAGLVYGFYDLNAREFIGKVIPYTEMISRGLSNIFIGVSAIDADGNTHDQNEFFGPKTSNTFIPTNIPIKTICPIYSLKTKNSTAIKINKIDPKLSKFDAWELPVSSGSFNKNINISNTRTWSSWHSKYVNQTLAGFYTTVEQFKAPWSNIYGFGYYDINNETPIIIDDKTIQLRRAPLMNVVYPTDLFSGIVGIIKQELRIFTRETESSAWTEISHSLIRDINSTNGIVEFNSRVVPSSKNLIKVSYVTSDKNQLLRQINGNPIPLNPLLNNGLIQFDKPLYIYLMPKDIYKYSEYAATGIGTNSWVKVPEYSSKSILNFTYDTSIFDSRSEKYDPFALPIAIIHITNNPYRQEPTLTDIRVRGGGVKVDVSNSELEQKNSNVLSYWDVYPPMGEAYAKGGFVIIRIPKEVKDHFLNEKEIYDIISNNLTAGVVYELQDMDGNSWI